MNIVNKNPQFQPHSGSLILIGSTKADNHKNVAAPYGSVSSHRGGEEAEGADGVVDAVTQGGSRVVMHQ